MRLEDLGVIGNCQFSALVDRTGSIVWCCLPRFDSDPIFGSLLDERKGGFFRVGLPGDLQGTQRYLPNTNVLETTFRGPDGAFRVIDFAPRYAVHDRFERPTRLVRIIEPISGLPRVCVRCEPVFGWSQERPARVESSYRVDFEGFPSRLRLDTDIPLASLDGRPFALTQRRYLVLGWGAPLAESDAAAERGDGPNEPLASYCERMLLETTRYWERWVKHCSVPPKFQGDVIRSALCLKLHCYEDTGAIIAAMTTSLPESPGAGRTWDYRYCWLRDAYYTLSAFRLLGHFEERESFTRYLLDIAGSSPSLDLAPLYRVDGKTELEEFTLDRWAGYEGDGPVRIGNEAAKHLQHDVFGEMVLALAPVLVDDRFLGSHTGEAIDLLERLADRAITVSGTPDAGIWEFRTHWRPQTFSSLMCWAAADRTARVASRHRPERAEAYRDDAERIHREILDRAYNTKIQSFASTYDGAELDAALLQMVSLRLLPSNDPRIVSTVDAVLKNLDSGGWLRRYPTDDFGAPTSAFILCTCWLVEALRQIGRRGAAEEAFAHVRGALSPLGLLAEDFDPVAKRLRGNFPQAYSHVGLIHAAFAVSPSWEEVL